ncbi:hypothetical protein IFM89_032651 [Coptis chinensis]|uniref:Uncharacterized protein n=1 Tax=Coptis chinensis TaxID=261450 RepID=A0A835HNJ3_9MAGN|nr:hypothetical protein IFM89_032651 [Coptis chinensis]
MTGSLIWNLKGDVKIDKDAYNAGNSPLNRKDPREQHRGKRYPRSKETDGIDTWRTPGTTQGTSEIGRDSSTIKNGVI